MEELDHSARKLTKSYSDRFFNVLLAVIGTGIIGGIGWIVSSLFFFQTQLTTIGVELKQSQSVIISRLDELDESLEEIDDRVRFLEIEYYKKKGYSHDSQSPKGN